MNNMKDTSFEIYKMQRRRGTLTTIFTLLIILGAIAIIAMLVSIPYWNYREYHVVELIVFQDNNKTLYEVKTDKDETFVFENEDMLFIGKTNSSSFGATLKRNEGECDLIIATRGYRIPLLSTYQNIVKIKTGGRDELSI